MRAHFPFGGHIARCWNFRGLISSSDRVSETLELRRERAYRDSLAPIPNQADNGDESRYADKRGTYSKGLEHDAHGLVVPSSFATFKTALRKRTPVRFRAHRDRNGRR